MITETEARGLMDHAVQQGTISREAADEMLRMDYPGPTQHATNAAAAMNAPTIPGLDFNDKHAVEVRTVADAMVRNGHMTCEQADAMVASELTALQTGIVSIPAPFAADPLAAAKVPPDFDRPASASQYQLPPAPSGRADVHQLQLLQQTFWQLRLPQPLAAELFVLADRYSAAPLDSAGVKALTQRTMAELQAIYGPETQARIDRTERIVAAVCKTNPLLRPLLATGLGSDPRFARFIIEHAGRLEGV